MKKIFLSACLALAMAGAGAVQTVQAQDVVNLTVANGVYTGSVEHGVPHGQGYMVYANQGGWYEGAFVDGKRDGEGIYVAPDRSRYTGQWKNDQRHGRGSETFALGGSYTGQWENDLFHGQGSIVYAGSGRRHQGVFAQGRPAGVAEPEVDAGQYVLKDTPRVGSHLATERATSIVPPLAKWDNLTEAQKNRVRAPYLALERGDDPPFPLYGTRELYQTVLRLTEKHDGLYGTANVLITVGADGKPKQGSVLASSNPTLGRLVLETMLVQKYKPARCQGQACEMAYAVNLDYTIK